jgi:hypothetical protein
MLPLVLSLAKLALSDIGGGTGGGTATELTRLVQQHRRSGVSATSPLVTHRPPNGTIWDPIFHVSPAKCGLGMLADPNGAPLMDGLATCTR